MFCSSCGTRNEEGTAYRVGCGAELRKIQTPSVEVPPLDTGGAGLSTGSAAGPGASVPNMPNYLVQAVLLTLAVSHSPRSRCSSPFRASSRASSPSSTGRRSTAKSGGTTTPGRGSRRTWPGCEPGSPCLRGPGVARTGRFPARIHPRVGRGKRLRLATTRSESPGAPPGGGRHRVTFAVSSQSQGVYSGASRTGWRIEGRQR